jgi:hypothetical protein
VMVPSGLLHGTPGVAGEAPHTAIGFVIVNKPNLVDRTSKADLAILSERLADPGQWHTMYKRQLYLTPDAPAAKRRKTCSDSE